MLPFPHRSRTAWLGFTIIEVMIVLTLLGLLAILAVPKYTGYILKAKFSEVVLATAPDKAIIELCVQDASCVNPTTNVLDLSIPTAPTLPDGSNFAATRYVAYVSHTDNGQVTAWSVGPGAPGAASLATQGFDQSYSYTIVPTLIGEAGSSLGRLDWTVSPASTCKSRPYGSLC